MKRLTKRQILLLHEQLLQEFGGTPGVRDEGLLDSALAAPFQTFDGQSLYPSVQAKAAQLGFGLVCNHPFVDGNKRIGTHVMLVFLALNKTSKTAPKGGSYTIWNVKNIDGQWQKQNEVTLKMNTNPH